MDSGLDVVSDVVVLVSTPLALDVPLETEDPFLGSMG